jgi:hypothetical protein
MRGVVVFFVLGVFELGMFSDTSVGATDRRWMPVAVAFLVWEILDLKRATWPTSSRIVSVVMEFRRGRRLTM